MHAFGSQCKGEHSTFPLYIPFSAPFLVFFFVFVFLWELRLPRQPIGIELQVITASKWLCFVAIFFLKLSLFTHFPKHSYHTVLPEVDESNRHKFTVTDSFDFSQFNSSSMSLRWDCASKVPFSKWRWLSIKMMLSFAWLSYEIVKPLIIVKAAFVLVSLLLGGNSQIPHLN